MSSKLIHSNLQNMNTSLRPPQRGRFITFEGTEGGGKSTQIALVKSALEALGLEVIVTREPGGTELSEKIRDLLLTEEMHENTELLLMFAARAEHVEKVIKPALSAGKWVLSDRFTESSYAYQGYGRGVDLDKIAQLERLVQGTLRPDITFWFDLPIEMGMKRVRRRAASDRFEQEQMAFFERVVSGFAQLAKARPEQFVRIDAKQSIEELNQNIMAEIERRLAPLSIAEK